MFACLYVQYSINFLKRSETFSFLSKTFPHAAVQLETFSSCVPKSIATKITFSSLHLAFSRNNGKDPGSSYPHPCCPDGRCKRSDGHPSRFLQAQGQDRSLSQCNRSHIPVPFLLKFRFWFHGHSALKENDRMDDEVLPASDRPKGGGLTPPWGNRSLIESKSAQKCINFTRILHFFLRRVALRRSNKILKREKHLWVLEIYFRTWKHILWNVIFYSVPKLLGKLYSNFWNMSFPKTLIFPNV